ncbi:hypothetical protein LC087_15315 [Bacillus carboniphilus]|uniref:Uncharacterized protein n=1 Tax=Bacillus carboniphilus TaxID=86663 RepID=A0ABY9JUF8_9BACI|nr:hypothetical protein [Bacillus carboniphilus]WLR42118.1 hypothetical protein LC087_15315 [Bacillus carboniphilus]
MRWWKNIEEAFFESSEREKTINTSEQDLQKSLLKHIETVDNHMSMNQYL